MKKIKFICMALALSLCIALCACDQGDKNNDKNQDENLNKYTVTVLNHSKWTLEGNADFYDLKGELAVSAPIENGKASADLDDGTYIVQIAKAPDSVSYNVVMLTAAEKMKTIEILNSEESDGLLKFDALVVAMRGNELLPDHQVTLCYEPENIEGGYCLIPSPTDANGSYSPTINAGRFHITITSLDYETVYDDYSDFSASQRFAIASVEQ